MSAAIPTSSSSQAAPPASSPPRIHRDPDSDPTPTVTVIVPSEIVAETKSDESITSLPAAPRPQSPEQPSGPVDQPARVESHTPDPAPAPRAAPVRPHSESERPLPAVPVNVTLPPPVQASWRQRVASDPGDGSAHRSVRHSEPPPVLRLDRPGSGVFRQRPATYAGEYEPREEWIPARVTSPSQGIYPVGSVGARLHPTLEEAIKVRNGASLHAKWAMYSINIAIALQVLLGALTTALGASLHGNSIRISIAVLGSLSTLVASYLARTRGTSEPESSLLREQALNHFIRNLRAFILDNGMSTDESHNQAVENFRREFERLLNASDPNTKKPPLFDPELKIG
ncbi:hypothetical protein EDB92DRAFT_1952870 [Lactarius akahatsu]|uniref:SMODS and SLOG-associating 2TM effector domain-containing protein n=1 Tax=Lactarius akahatsu TaxID=416441 RepID=A0AAD4Q3Q3_9AGAM|nr:hypothetical protein EDB92DRAFT_1952870 [Lactarius akahatsu]